MHKCAFNAALKVYKEKIRSFGSGEATKAEALRYTA